jgi:hypothetical protein
LGRGWTITGGGVIELTGPDGEATVILEESGEAEPHEDRD